MSRLIVWVEDDSPVIRSVVRPLERSGYRVEKYLNLGEALANIDTIGQADLILLDMILPKGNLTENFGRYPGLTLLRRLRNDYGLGQPVIILSVIREDEIRRELKEDLGVFRILTKPTLPSEIKRQVALALGLVEGVR